MTSSREKVRMEVLLDGLVDCVGLPRIHWWVEQNYPNAPVSQLQTETIETIRSLSEDGLVDTGYPNDGKFVAEHLAESLQEIQNSYIAHYEEPIEWMGRVWVNLTDKGQEVATSTQTGQRVQRHEVDRR